MGFSKFIAITLLATALVASVESHGDCSFNYSSYDGSPKKFNIILKDKMAAESHFKWLSNCCNKSVRHIANVDLTDVFDENDARDFSVEDAIYGYTAYFDPEFVEKHLEKNDDIKVAEEDSEVSIQHRRRRRHNHHNHHYNNHHCHNHYHQKRLRTSVREDPTPNLDRIDTEKFELDQKYVFPATAGEGVTIYVVDTGILISHNEFEGRAVHGGSFCAGCGDTDDEGHGTHVAAIAGGKTFGVANKANLVAIKVFGSGPGSFSDLIAGLAFVLADHLSNPGQKSVVNMSLGGGKTEAVNAAVKALTDNGIHNVVAAGNEADDACNVSPASEPSAITVGATENTSDSVTNFSNIGNCVDIFAPGRNIKSAGIGSNDDTAEFSGTSQATPHVAGTVALIIGEFGNSSPAEMTETLIRIASKGVIPEDTLRGSPNVFVRVPFEKKNNKCYHNKHHHDHHDH